MATINIGELATMTLRNRRKVITDNMTNHNAALRKMNVKGKVKPFTGGRTIVEELEYGENSTVMWFSGYEVFDITPQEVFDAAEYEIKQMIGSVSMSGIEKIKNRGENAIFPWMAKKISNLEKSMQNQMATAIYGDGTASSGKSLGGLALLVADNPTTGTVGGINRATYTWARNQYSASATTSSTNILSRMNTFWLTMLRGTDKPDIILCDATMYGYFEGALQPLQRFTETDSAKAGFESYKYKSADLVYDDQCPSKHMYFLNTDYLYLRPDSEMNFAEIGERKPVNQDATIIPVTWAGNLTCSNFSLQGVMIAT